VNAKKSTAATATTADPNGNAKGSGLASVRYRLKLATWTVVREPGQPSPSQLDRPEIVATLARDLLATADDDKEHFWILLLNAQNGHLLTHLVSTGSQSASIVHPREVLGPAMREGAAHLIVLHNHPSGDPTPSKEDIRITAQLAEGARLLGLTLHDHLVIGHGTLKWVSLAQRGLL
jgi:DNA repair protein RadC